jgi:hypothetical protein
MGSRFLRGASAAVVLGLAAAVAGEATTLRPMPVARVAARASAVVVGTLHGVSCRRAVAPSGRTRIFTDHDFRDLAVVSGSVGTRNLVLPVVGGTLDGRTLSVPGAPRYEVGRRYCLFLDPGEPLCGTAGWTRGVFRVERDAGGTERVFDHDGAPVGAVAGGRAVKGGEPMPLADFLSATAALAREGERRDPRGRTDGRVREER